MDRRLPPEYEGWQLHEQAFRRLSTPELVQEIQDGGPERRLAALSVIDLGEVDRATIEDWIRTLPDAEANELAGAIPAQRPLASCSDDLRWVEMARLGYGWRRLPTFLVMLFSSLDAMDAKRCPEAAAAWEATGKWLVTTYGQAADDADQEALDDVSLFVFENYLERAPVFEAFCELIDSHLPLAEAVSANPSHLLIDLPEEMQRRALKAAEAAGGLSFDHSWTALHDPGRAED